MMVQRMKSKHEEIVARYEKNSQENFQGTEQQIRLMTDGLKQYDQKFSEIDARIKAVKAAQEEEEKHSTNSSFRQVVEDPRARKEDIKNEIREKQNNENLYYFFISYFKTEGLSKCNGRCTENNPDLLCQEKL